MSKYIVTENEQHGSQYKVILDNERYYFDYNGDLVNLRMEINSEDLGHWVKADLDSLRGELGPVLRVLKDDLIEATEAYLQELRDNSKFDEYRGA